MNDKEKSGDWEVTSYLNRGVQPKKRGVQPKKRTEQESLSPEKIRTNEKTEREVLSKTFDHEVIYHLVNFVPHH